VQLLHDAGCLAIDFQPSETDLRGGSVREGLHEFPAEVATASDLHSVMSG